METKKVKAKFAYADRQKIPYAVVIGGDEKQSGTVSLKDLRTGAQTVVTAAGAAAVIQNGISYTAKPVKA